MRVPTLVTPPSSTASPFVLFHIPSSFLTAREQGLTRIYINAGAIVDLDVLIEEIERLKIRHHEIFVNPNAAIILPEDTEEEKQRTSSATKIASTQKGVGAALARKVARRGPNLGQFIRTSTAEGAVPADAGIAQQGDDGKWTGSRRRGSSGLLS
jgi:adenylosuccinate synthase